MTSRQPESTQPGSMPGEGGGDRRADHYGTGDHASGDNEADDHAGGDSGAGDHADQAVTTQDWLLRLLPLTLLLLVALTGLRGAVGRLRWDGPLHADGLAVGVVLEVLIVTMIVILLRRRRLGSQEATAVKLRDVLLFVLGAGAIAAGVLAVIGLHLHGLSGKPNPLPSRSLPPAPTPKPPKPHTAPAPWLHISLTAVLYTLLVAVLLAGVAASIWWARRLRPPIAPRDDDFIVADPERLREAVESGRSALRSLDDARAAIIACYLAMETSLAERGTARGVADTPGELLTRARGGGLVRGTAAGRLTALFYEARFSSHPMSQGQRDAAERALDELAADLAKTAETTVSGGATGVAGVDRTTGAGGAAVVDGADRTAGANGAGGGGGADGAGGGGGGGGA
jgi:Domain of unknown function (DUF4129)